MTDVQKVSAKTTIQSVSRAARILVAVAANPDAISSKAAAENFGLSPPAAYHLLTTLERKAS